MNGENIGTEEWMQIEKVQKDALSLTK